MRTQSPRRPTLAARRSLAARLIVLLAAIASASCASQQGGGAPLELTVPESGPVPWTGDTPLEHPDDFRFVVVTDRTGEAREGVFESAIPKVELLKPAFVMSVGDLIEGYTDDREQLAREWDEFEGFVDDLSMPFFYLPGNHDMSNRVMGEVWRERFGASFYHFRFKDVLFLALNSELFNMVGSRGPVEGVESQAEQMAFVERVLSENADARWTLVFVHQPLWDSPVGRIHPDWLRVEELLGARPYTVFAGHYHAYTKMRRNDRSFITLGTTGGGSGLRGTAFGEFDHVALVTMKREGPVIANLMLDGIHGEDVRTEAVRNVANRLERAVRLVPGEHEGSRFWRSTVEVVLRNDGETPLRVSGHLEGSANLAVGVAGGEAGEHEIVRELAPGASEVIPVALRATDRRGVPFVELEAGRAHLHLEQDTPAGERVAIESEVLLFPGHEFDVAHQRRPVAVDGDLTEWGPLRFQMADAANGAGLPWEIEHGEHYRGREDASLRFDVREGNDTLYLAFDVRDDSPVFSGRKIARKQDGVAISIDARPDPERSATGAGFFAAIADGTFAKLLVLDGLPGEPAFDSVFATFVPPTPDKIEIEAVESDTGYRVEMAIPWLELELRAGGPVDAVRLEISQRDFDPGEPGHATLWWRPSRFGALAVEGTATFVRGKAKHAH